MKTDLWTSLKSENVTIEFRDHEEEIRKCYQKSENVTIKSGDHEKELKFLWVLLYLIPYRLYLKQQSKYLFKNNVF
jgi:hypothetical protein